MKINLLVFFSVIFGSFRVDAQEICMVSADLATGEDYIVYWEQPANISNIDSVIVYKQTSPITGFIRIGALKVNSTNPTSFTDLNANTIDTARYAIAFKDFSNVEGARSLWHQPIIYDYSVNGSGSWSWSPYIVEGVAGPSPVIEYRCLRDEYGTGTYTTIGTIFNFQTYWSDPDWASYTTAFYVIEAELPTCNYIEKANINTSRSNIKNQFTNAEAGVSEQSLSGVTFEILTNPILDELTIEFGSELNDAKTWIIATSGEVVNTLSFSGNKLQINLSDLSKGIYFFNVEVNGVVSTKRFVKS